MSTLLLLLNELWRNIDTDCSSNNYRVIVYTQITDSFSLFVSISLFLLAAHYNLTNHG